MTFSWRILRSKWRILRSPMPNEHPVNNPLFSSLHLITGSPSSRHVKGLD